ncbi:MAG: metallophosphoesterase [Bdellovibrionales bacterium]|nr:metallophosphoesterase [Bdellovibrionales bacterium]
MGSRLNRFFKDKLFVLLSFAIIGDAGDWNKSAQLVQRSIIQGKVQNLVLPGDNLYVPDKSYSEVWSNWSKLGFKFSVVAIGNHNKGYDQEMKYFKMPSEYFSKHDGTVRFVVLNSDNENTAGAQGRFLDQELRTAKERFIFVVYHHPSFTLSGHGWQEKQKFQNAVRPLLIKYQNKITAIINGHDHVDELAELNDRLPMIISGAVFETLKAKPVNYMDGSVHVKTRWVFDGGYYWTRLDLNSETGEAWINYVSASLNRVTCSVRIAPRPLLMRENCSQYGAGASNATNSNDWHY